MSQKINVCIYAKYDIENIKGKKAYYQFCCLYYYSNSLPITLMILIYQPLSSSYNTSRKVLYVHTALNLCNATEILLYK